MADVRGVWGIEIGQAGLKAVRLRYAEAAKQVIAIAFDYVPHAKILSQPDANPEELIALALDTFLSRNSTEGDVIAISVPKQMALARFIQLPPVESSKVVEIVKYEARQQIPFALEDVVWDFQPLGGGVEESGYMLEAEVGLFAIKRDDVQQQLAPYLQRKVEVELVQIAPLALYNYLCHDQMGHQPGVDPVEDEEYTIVLDMGADNTTLLVSNGKKIWTRNVPLGGNHFTRALTKEMKLTFAKAEHLKCNATKAPDPKAIFQALRPVFNDYVNEIQRSIGYFSSVKRNAKIKKIVGVGNGFKLAGLQKFLQQNLQLDVERVEAYPGLVGDTVLNAPLFQENILSFAVPYGLALQGLKLTRVYTSLLPPEITTARIIRRKKPWAVVAAAGLLLALAMSSIGYAYVLSTVSTQRFGESESQAKSVTDRQSRMKTEYDGAVAKNKELKAQGDLLLSSESGRTDWLELYKAINECLPRDVGDQRDEDDPTKKHQIRLFSITSERLNDVGTWFAKLDARDKTFMRKEDLDAPPKGPGYVFTLKGQHFHADRDDFNQQGVLYVVNRFLNNLKQWDVQQPDSPAAVPVRKLGITHATIPSSNSTSNVKYVPPGNRTVNPGAPGTPPGAPPPGVAGGPGAGSPRSLAASKRKKRAKKAELEPGDEAGQMIPQTDFEVQFVWIEVPPEKRPLIDPNPPKIVNPPGAPGMPGTPQTAPGAPVPPQAAPTAPPSLVQPPAAAHAAPPGAPPGTAPGLPPGVPSVPGGPPAHAAPPVKPGG